jgi:hypothetical protein
MRKSRLRPCFSWLAALACAAGCLSTEGYYRYQDGGATGAAGSGPTGVAGTTGAAGTVGTAGTGGSSPTGVAGTTGVAGRGGTTGVAGTTGAAGRGGTTGTAGRGGATGVAGTTGGASLFTENFETPLGTRWDFSVGGTHMVVADGTQALNLNESAGEQVLAAAGQAMWTNISIEARVKVLAFNGSSSSDVAAICARLTDTKHFYYFAIQSDGKGKIKIQADGNSSLGSSIEIGYAPNTWFTMKLQIIGNTLTAFINGSPVGEPFTATETDQILPMGGIGLMVQRANAVFDDVVVRSAP